VTSANTNADGTFSLPSYVALTRSDATKSLR